MTESYGRRHVEGATERRRVLVLGAGFIGSAAGAALLRAGHEVTALTRSELRPSRRRLLEGATVVFSEDWLDTLPPLLAEADDLLYCVGSSSPTESEIDPVRDISAVLPPIVRVLELIRLHPSTRLTFMSSGGTVYGEPRVVPIDEDAPTQPISSYGILKLACENYVRMYSRVHGLDTRILRISNPYGPTQDSAHGQGLIARLLQCAIDGAPVTLFGRGEAVRDYLHVDDLAEAIVGVVQLDELPPVLNVGSGVGHTSRSVAELVREVTGADFEIRLAGPRGFDVAANVLNVDRAVSALGLTPRELRGGVCDTWDAISRDGRFIPRVAAVSKLRAEGI